MIDRDNYHAVQAYLQYCQEIRQNTQGTLNLRWAHLRHLIEWADEAPLMGASAIGPSFPEYLANVRNERTNGDGLSPRTQRDICRTVQAFFGWAKANQRGYRGISPMWVESIKPPRQMGQVAAKREVWTIEDVRKIAEYNPPTLTLRREQAAIVMLFLSGMRVGALVTLPAVAVDIDARSVDQFPSLGVHTKNLKAATTYLLNIPGLLAVVENWHSLVSESLSPNDPWYAHISSDGTEFVPGMPATDTRRSRVRKGMRQLCELVGVEYKRPHALRHGHAVWALSNAGSVADLKAVSQNLMHKSLFTTDEIYGVLTGNDTRERVVNLAKKERADDNLSALADQIAERVAQKLGL